MPSMKGVRSIAANATNANVLENEDMEFVPYDALVSVAVAQSATGLELDFKQGTDSLASGISPNIVSATGRVEDDTDTILRNEPVPAGKRLKLPVRNTTAGALSIFYTVNIDRFIRGM